jgi:hypothetical protein
MSALARAFFLSVALATTFGAARASPDDAVVAGFICARPFAPACADNPATFRSAEDIAACQRELDRYAAWTAAYRDCLERQITSAVRHTNEVLDRFRCLSRRDCPPAAKQP